MYDFIETGSFTWPTDAMYMKEGFFTWLNKRLGRIYLACYFGNDKK